MSFNSLSRDHVEFGTRPHVIVPRTFNSLSRDHFALSSAIKSRWRSTFNSLSRDHAPYHEELARTEIPALSTPSLGITEVPRPDDLVALGLQLVDFQLPLSGSQ